jgi:hypothetical protein
MRCMSCWLTGCARAVTTHVIAAVTIAAQRFVTTAAHLFVTIAAHWFVVRRPSCLLSVVFLFSIVLLFLFI